MAASDRALRYLVSLGIADSSIHVGLQPIDSSGAFAVSGGTENRVEFHTHRYGNDRLAVCGPGAGPQVTALGVVGDLIDLAGSAGEESP